MAATATVSLATGVLAFLPAGVAHASTSTFGYTGGAQTYVVPPGVTAIDVVAYGASGAQNGGAGSAVRARLEVTPGETLWVVVGGAGSGLTGGFNGGGAGATSYYSYYGGGGGGASDIRRTANSVSNRILVAGGGGGGLYEASGGSGDRPGHVAYSSTTDPAGDAGFGAYSTSRVNGALVGTGSGGQVAGRSRLDLMAPSSECGPGGDGGQGTGGAGAGAAPGAGYCPGAGGGGGGGYQGGGGGAGSEGTTAGGGSGGGGSSYVDPTAANIVVTAGGAPGGSGSVQITEVTSPPGQPRQLTAAPGPSAGQITLVWLPPKGSTAGLTYTVHRRTASTGWVTAGTTSLLSFTDSGRLADTTYYYAVSANNGAGDGTWSAETSAGTYAVEGPYSTVTPNYNGHVDQTYYKVGLRVRYNGQTYGAVQEGVLDGGLPKTTPAYPYDVAVGADGDGDGVPGTLVIRYRTTTVTDQGSTSHTNTSTATPQVDPDDADDTNPTPQVVDGPYAEATPGSGGDTFAVHYKVGAVVRYAGQNYGQVIEGTVAPFHDADGDFVPDGQEAVLCANENPNFNFDGTCSGADYAPPTVAGILDDLG